jgi:methylated-DNA-[protein]-cysteine S-methyltransferase
VGNILNKNRDFRNIPCHRVIRSNGQIGGYVLGVEIKKLLLRKEQTKRRNLKVYRNFIKEI